MPAPSWEDLDVFLDPADFGTPGTITFQGGAPSRVVYGIYDGPYLNAELGEFDLDTVRPRFLAKASDFADVHEYDQVHVAGVLWDVETEPQPTGDGMAVLSLAKAHVAI